MKVYTSIPAFKVIINIEVGMRGQNLGGRGSNEAQIKSRMKWRREEEEEEEEEK